MHDEIVDFEEYKKLFNIKNELKEGKISIDELSLEELEDVNKLYQIEIEERVKHINNLKDENEKLKQRIRNLDD